MVYLNCQLPLDFGTFQGQDGMCHGVDVVVKH
jgi:hypothetical protein